MLASITVDNEACLGPLECRKCLVTCPVNVFLTGPTKRWKFRESDPKEYAMYARYYDQCIGCMDCVEVCPVDAITVAFEQMAETG